MPNFALKYPFFIIMVCLVIMVVGVVSIASMPVDLFPQIDMPVVVVATFYSGMPPKQIEADITDTFERFFTLGSNIERIESRSLTGVSLIKIYFKPAGIVNSCVCPVLLLKGIGIYKPDKIVLVNRFRVFKWYINLGSWLGR